MEPIRVSAPGRVGIIGNPTDMYGGSVLSCTTQERAVVTVEDAPRLTLAAAGKELVIGGRDDLSLKRDLYDVPKAVLGHLHLYDEPIKVTIASAIPFQAGMSGSAALVVSTLQALWIYMGERHGPYHLAEVARSIELSRMQNVCGYQDFYMTTFGGINYMDFRDKQFYREVALEHYGTIERLDDFVPTLPFVCAKCGVRPASGVVHKPIRERWLEGDKEVVDAYVRIGALAREGKKALLLGDCRRLGELMNENHAIQRRLGGSGPDNERMIMAALDGGAYGAKLAGAGNGGTTIALHPDPELLARHLLSSGAERIIHPLPSQGVRVESDPTAQTDHPMAQFVGSFVPDGKRS
jgi:galactokinase/mevalonate kinase-like predicted kinase